MADGPAVAAEKEELAIVVGALVRIGEGGVGGMDPDELVGRRALSVGGHHVRVARAGQPPVRGLDLLAGGVGGEAQDVVERGEGRLRSRGEGSGGWAFRRGGVRG